MTVAYRCAINQLINYYPHVYNINYRPDANIKKRLLFVATILNSFRSHICVETQPGKVKEAFIEQFLNVNGISWLGQRRSFRKCFPSSELVGYLVKLRNTTHTHNRFASVNIT